MQRGSPSLRLRQSSHRAMVAWAVLLFSCVAPLTVCGQDATSAGSIVYHVHGVVLNGVTNQPVARALVMSTDQRLAAMTDDNGRFDFEVHSSGESSLGGGLPQMMMSTGPRGSMPQRGVSLMARRPGYLPLQRPVTLLLSDKSSISSDMQIKLMPEAILKGHVSTSGVQLFLLHRQVMDGVGSWMQAGSTQSNSRGDYRFADLAAGEYKLMTREWSEAGAFAPASASQIGYPPVYYPDATDLASGVTIHIHAGETAQANLGLRAQRFYPVSVPVTNIPQGTSVNVSLGVEDGVPGFSLGFNAKSQAITGSLPAGTYDVRATSFGPVQSAGAGKIEVAEGAVKVAPIALLPSGTIPVIVREEYTANSTNGRAGEVQYISGGRLQSARTLDLSLRPEGSNQQVADLRNEPGKGGGNDDLVVENVREGKYRVLVTAFRGYAASVTSNGVDLLRQPLIVGAGGASAPIEVTLRDDVATLTGTVSPLPAAGATDGSNGPAAFLWCLPVENYAGRLMQTWVGEDGKFQVNNLPPGQYLVLATPTQTMNLEYRNEETMRRYQSKGTLVTLAAGQNADIQVPMLAEEEE
jgi:hypothetical protein